MKAEHEIDSLDNLPDIAGVSRPSPMTIHVPSKTKISKAMCKDL